MADLSFTLAAIEPMVFRIPVEVPVRTAFGIMHSRPGLLVRVVDQSGAEGWGEIWCNFPSFGAEHRANAVREALAPLALGRRFQTPQEAFADLSARLEVLSLQAGEPGPFAQIVAGLDIAIWDMLGHRNGVSVQRLLSGHFVERVPAYASGIGPEQPEETVLNAMAEGHSRFKLKVGFGDDNDLANLGSLRQMLGSEGVLMADANQAWSPERAHIMGRRVDEFGLAWLEEPMRVDTAPEDWASLANSITTPLAGGENLRGFDAFDQVSHMPGLRVIQPDIGKWGGFSGCLPVARQALARGRRFCPHWLGGGIGLIASAHLLALAGGDGYVEVDVNPNPFRTKIDPQLRIDQGSLVLSDTPGLGVTHAR